ncbi:MAG: T9SS type A sorting domain-containing protein [Bacteroidetes bacterium]|nr:T9SS type A sorting domain-containing protein [Bacteroidota bacterium]
MKKTLHILAALALAFSFGETKAQLADGSTAPNFTFTDMKGNTQDLYTYLNAGKVVVIDVSATWCNPCWVYHTSGALDQFYNTYGPSGSNKATVIFIEGDAATNDACMTNTGGCSKTPSQGDWTLNTAYPECNPTTAQGIGTFNSNYAIAYFPTMYMICVDKKIKKVDQYTAAQLASALNATCPPPSAGNDAGVSSVAAPNAFACGTSFTPSVTIRNFGNAALTSCTINYKVDNNPVQTYNWTGNLSSGCSIYTTGCTATITLPSITTALGSHTFTAYTSNPNSGADVNTANDSQNITFNAVTPSTSPVTEGVEGTFPDATCAVVNPDAGTTWVKHIPGGNGASANSSFMDCYNYAATGEMDYMVLAPMDFSNATSAQLTFDVAYAPYDATYFEKLDVEVSTNCGATWTNVYSKQSTTLATAAANTNQWTPSSTQWRTETINLSSYLGQSSVLAHFICTNGYGNELYVDNINLSALTSVSEMDMSNYISVFPNPSAGEVYVNVSPVFEKALDFKVTNMFGETVKKFSDASKHIEFTLNNLPNGMYFIEIQSGNSKTVKKIMLNK